MEKYGFYEFVHYNDCYVLGVYANSLIEAEEKMRELYPSSYYEYEFWSISDEEGAYNTNV